MAKNTSQNTNRNDYQPQTEQEPNQGISNHDLKEEKSRQAKVIPFRDENKAGTPGEDENE